MKPCIIIGSSGHAHSALETIEAGNRYVVIGFLDDFRALGELEHGLPILGKVEDCVVLARKHDCHTFFLGVGDNWGRYQVHKKVKTLYPAAQFPGIAHPQSIISNTVTIPDAGVILPGAIVGRYATLGIGCLLNHQSCLDHDSSLGDYASLGPQAAVGGRTHIGNFSAICMGAKVHQKIKVGHHTTIGSGAVVTKDIPDQVVAFGIPATARKTRTVDDKYL